MNRRLSSRTRQRQINILFAHTKQRHSRKKVMRGLLWGGLLLLTLAGAGYATNMIMGVVLDNALYKNSQYALKKIVIETKGDFSQHEIKQAAGLSIGQNIWALNMAQIQRNIERLPYVAEARIEKHLPDKLVIKITERIPIAKVTCSGSELGTREVLYVDRDHYVLFKPRPGETIQPLPDITGLRNTEFEAGQRLDQPEAVVAINLLKEMEMTPLHTAIDVKSVDVNQPLSLKVTTTQGSVVFFRLNYLGQQLQRLQEIMGVAQQRQRLVATVDLTLDRNVPVTFVQ
jgi:cell division protein FtsQ